MSDAIFLTRNDEQAELAFKINRIEYEEANAALETSSIQDVVRCDQDQVTGTLHNKKTYTTVQQSQKQVIRTKWVFASKRNEYG